MIEDGIKAGSMANTFMGDIVHRDDFLGMYFVNVSKSHLA